MYRPRRIQGTKVPRLGQYIAAVAVLLLAACTGKDPGPLEGTWQVDGMIPMTATFRSGESEAMGIIDKVSYKTNGADVLMTYEDGMAKGTTMRFTMTGPDAARAEIGSMCRVSN